MLNKITVAKFWMVSSFFAAASVFAKDCNNTPAPATKCCPKKTCEQPCELPPAPTMAAYNAPARIDVCGSWDTYATASFIYWQAQQENLELGIAVPNGAINLVNTQNTPTAANPGNVINMDFDFKPGFKVGLGMNFDYDNWDGYAEYTWFHGTNSQSSNTQGGSSVIWVFGFHQTTLSDATMSVATQASENWNLKMDFADVVLGRSYYVGTKLSFRPFAGARGAWIRQRDSFAASIAGNTGFVRSPSVPTTLTSTQTSTSWGVGPSLGLDGNWMFGYGLRFEGRAETDLLYTRYTTRTKEFATNTSTGAILSQLSVKQADVAYLRPHANLEMGLGWGSYFDNNNWHFDLLASYGFQVFWNQNMFRNFLSSGSGQAIGILANGDLFVHGLNLTARFDF